MSVNEFANVGVFIIASFGFALGTGVVGALMSGDYDCASFASWIVGIFVYGFTVMFMWRW